MDTQIDQDWCVVENKFEIAKNRHYESIFALGSGYMTTRASVEEGFEDDDQSLEFDRYMVNVTLEVIPAAKSKWGTYMPVIQARHPHLMVGIVNLPYYLGLVVYADGEKLDLEASKITHYRRWLDLRTATLYRTLVWETRSGKRIELRFTRFVNPEEKFVCVQRCQIKMLAGSAEIQVVHFVDNNVRTNGFDKFTRTSVDHINQILYSDVTTNLNNRVLTASVAHNTRTEGWTFIKDARRISAASTFALEAGEEAAVTKISAVITDMYFPADQLLENAQTATLRSLAQPVETLHQAHCAVWARHWAASDVEIQAQDKEGFNSQLAIRTAIYHLLRAQAPDEDRGLPCPKGLTAETYFGSVLWDMDIFIQPFYLYTTSQAARVTSMFRYRGLTGARALAKQHQYPGARYPWQSDRNGEETCVIWQYADHEIHITADVAIGIWHYYASSGDLDFLFDYGAEILVETARYWTARVDMVPGVPGYQIYGVMGPDEYKPLTNNNAYTNYVARFNLNLAVKAIEMMRAQAPGKYQKLAEKIGLKEAELLQFADVAASLSIPMDPARHLIWQCDHWETAFVELDIEGIWQDRTRLFGSYISQEKRYRSKCLKQPDVVAMLGIFTEAYPPAVMKASFDYYARYDIHDSSVSMVHHQIVAAKLGRRETAYEAWLSSIDIDFGQRPRSADGVHMGNVGGMWQEIVFGFCGMVSALNTEVLTFNPCLPEQIRQISYQVQWRGKRVFITVTGSTIKLENLSNEDLPFVVKGKQYAVRAGDKVEVAYSNLIGSDWIGSFPK